MEKYHLNPLIVFGLNLTLTWKWLNFDLYTVPGVTFRKKKKKSANPLLQWALLNNACHQEPVLAAVREKFTWILFSFIVAH